MNRISSGLMQADAVKLLFYGAEEKAQDGEAENIAHVIGKGVHVDHRQEEVLKLWACAQLVDECSDRQLEHTIAAILRRLPPPARCIGQHSSARWDGAAVFHTQRRWVSIVTDGRCTVDGVGMRSNYC